MKTQLWPCTPSPAICGWYLPGLPPSCLGSAGDLTRRSAWGDGVVLVKSCFASTIFGPIQRAVPVAAEQGWWRERNVQQND